MDIKKRDNTSGLLSLEASIALTIFIFLMLFMYSFFVVFEARNEIGHVLLSTADSLALDAFANEAAETGTVQEILIVVYGAISNDENYTNVRKWYSGSDGLIQDTIQNRFMAYLAGGDTDKADALLKQLNVVDGISGLDFSQSKVSDNNIYLVVKYKLDYEFKVFGLGTMEFEQKCCSKLWNGQNGTLKTEEGTQVSETGGDSAGGSDGGGFR